MSISAFTGPVLGFGGSNNPDRGPSGFDQGVGLLDPREPFSYKPAGNKAYMWAAPGRICVIQQVPSALAANNIAASQVPVAGTALTLTAGTGVTSGVSITRADTGATVTGLYALDTAMSPIGFGQSDIVRGWDPSKGIARCVRVVSAGDDSNGTFTINGYDLYGYPLTQTVTGGAVATATTTKAFKYIASVVPAGTLSGSAVTVGTTDVIGLPIRADYFSEIEVWWNNAQVTATTGFTAAVTTDPSTATTGDVRGTYALQSAASNGTLRLTVYVTPSVANVQSATGLFGVAQV